MEVKFSINIVLNKFFVSNDIKGIIKKHSKDSKGLRSYNFFYIYTSRFGKYLDNILLSYEQK